MHQEHVVGSSRAALLHGLPVRERRLSVNGIDTCVMEGGQGSPLVLLHGGSQAGGVLWTATIPRLVDRYTVVVPDLPGLGESDPAARLDSAAVGGWLAELLPLTCHDRPTLIAHSLPGALAARFAVHHGELLRRLVLVATPAVGRFRPPPALLLAALRLNLRPSERNLARFARWPYFDVERTRAQHGEWHDALDAYLLERAAVPSVKRAMRQLVKAGSSRIADGELHGIKVPVTLVWGRGDRMAPPALGEAASAKLGWPLHMIDEAGHLPHVEQPPAFVDALKVILDAR